MFWRNKPEPKNTTRRNTLTIVLKKSDIKWWQDNYEGSSLVKPWTKFYKWYFSKEQDEFMVTSKNEHQLLRRKDIVGFCVKIEDVEI